MDGAYWLIGTGSAGLAQGCRCALPLQAWTGAYRGGRPFTACLLLFYAYVANERLLLLLLLLIIILQSRAKNKKS